jgi:hypothetical protein
MLGHVVGLLSSSLLLGLSGSVFWGERRLRQSCEKARGWRVAVQALPRVGDEGPPVLPNGAEQTFQGPISEDPPASEVEVYYPAHDPAAARLADGLTPTASLALGCFGLLWLGTTLLLW